MYTKFNSITTINSLFLSNQCNSNLNSQIEKIIDNSSEYFSFKHIQRKIDINLQLPYEFLFMTDRLSMANSIEARTPFLDKNLYNYICNVDINKISKQSDPKFALRKLFNLNIKDFNLPSLKKGFVIPDELFYNSNKELFNYLTSFSFLKSQNIFNYNLDIFKENKIKENKNLFKCFIHFQLFYFYNVYES
jgi:asparagine synthase (glutamine-hydrolysing)